MPNETQAKYHHLIPQTYMSAWANSSGTLRIEEKDSPGVVFERNKEKIGGITDFHTIAAGSPLCTQNDADLIFSPVATYCVNYEGRTIQDTLELNRIYWDFDNWVITSSDGTPVSKKRIRNDIEQVKIKDIEANWSSKYENGWASQVQTIEDKVLKSTTNAVDAFDKEYLMKFFVALDWRGFKSNDQFENAVSWLCTEVLPLGEVDIPEDERLLPSLPTAADEMRHNLLLQYFRQYLDDRGVIYQAALVNLKNTSFHFLVSDGPTLFITSDTPAFVYTRPDGSKMGLMPITPHILLVQGKQTEDSGEFYITHITDEAVQKYNEVIRQNADGFVILNW